MAQVYKSAGVQAARIAGESAEMDVVARQIEATVRGLAASHNVTGEYMAGIGTERTPGKRGVTDRIVFVDHEAAASIEFGHMTRRGKTHGPQRFVPGLHIFGRAAK